MQKNILPYRAGSAMGNPGSEEVPLFANTEQDNVPYMNTPNGIVPLSGLYNYFDGTLFGSGNYPFPPANTVYYFLDINDGIFYVIDENGNLNNLQEWQGISERLSVVYGEVWTKTPQNVADEATVAMEQVEAGINCTPSADGNIQVAAGQGGWYRVTFQAYVTSANTAIKIAVNAVAAPQNRRYEVQANTFVTGTAVITLNALDRVHLVADSLATGAPVNFNNGSAGATGFIARLTLERIG